MWGVWSLAQYRPRSNASIILVLLLVLVCSKSGHASILRVPHDYPSIQVGLMAARAGDIVLVAAGIYYENLTMDPNTSKILDEPLLGFSLGIIAFDDTTPSPANEFDIRVRKRLRDPNDQQPCT